MKNDLFGKFQNEAAQNTPKENMIPVNGMEQVLEMLRVADAEFREVLLRGIEKRDPRLARQLRLELQR